MNNLLINFGYLASLLLLTMDNVIGAQLTPEQETARDKGIASYNMERAFTATPFLEIAAAAGDKDSQYYLAEIIRIRHQYVTPEAQALYESVANKGDVYAMMRLSDEEDLCHIMKNCTPGKKTSQEWSDTARSLAEDRARQGDGEAMLQLFLMTSTFDWLIKSAESGFPDSQVFLGSLYNEGAGTFLIPGARQKEVEKWLKASAEGGNAVGMSKYAEFLDIRGDTQGLGYWIEKAAEAGHFSSMSGYAAWTAHMPDKVGYPLDLVKAYGLTLLMAEADPGLGEHRLSYGEETLLEVAEKMTPEQIEAGKAYAKDWARTHPPLSRFPPKYGY